ncbi:MAG: ABC transporter substrate-binding protein [Ferruginibacter sp.]|nr:ABC transporter substrate-binding protein [Ferruginibacter sp.]
MILNSSSQPGFFPKRIISLVPSQTELLHYFNLEEETIAITKFCVHPTEWYKSKTKIGGTKTINIEKVKELNPDLIIANKEENTKEQVEQLANYYPIWLTDVNNLQDALQMIEDIGNLVQKAKEAKELIKQVKINFVQIPGLNHTIRTAYLIWKNPFMAAGCNTFINDMLTCCGFKNVFATTSRYPQVNIEAIKKANCQLLLLSSEPYPFKQKHIEELSEQLPTTKIMLVDGEMFSWYGSRLLKAPAYFTTIINAVNK